MHGKRLTQHLKDEGAAVARKFGFRDNDLWNSFLYFFAVLIKHQPLELRSSSWNTLPGQRLSQNRVRLHFWMGVTSLRSWTRHGAQDQRSLLNYIKDCLLIRP